MKIKADKNKIIRLIIKDNVELFTIYSVLIVIALIGTIFVPNFSRSQNIKNILLQAVALGLVSIGQTLVILSGGLDLSVGATISMVAVYTSGMMASSSEGYIVLFVVIMTICMAVAIGIVNALIITKLKISPFVGTLAMGSIVQGIVLMYTKVPKGMIVPEWKFFAEGYICGIPFAVFFFFFFIILSFYVLRKTILGLYIYAVGDNEETARLSGIRTTRIIIFVYMFSSFMASLSALFLISRMGIGDPQVGGLNYQLYDLESIAAVLVGGTSLSGGVGGVIGTLAGVLILTMLNNIFNLSGVSTFYQWLIKGIIIIGAVAVYRLLKAES